MTIKGFISLILALAVTSTVAELYASFIPVPNFTKNYNHLRFKNQDPDFDDERLQLSVPTSEFWNGLENIRPRYNGLLPNIGIQIPKWVCDNYGCFPKFDNENRLVHQKADINKKKYENSSPSGYFSGRGNFFQQGLNSIAQGEINPSLNFKRTLNKKPSIFRLDRSENPSVIKNPHENFDIESDGILSTLSEFLPMMLLKSQLKSVDSTNHEKTQGINNFEKGRLDENKHYISGYPDRVHPVNRLEDDDKFEAHPLSGEGRLNYVPVGKCRYGAALDLHCQREFGRKGKTLIEILLGPNFLRNAFTEQYDFSNTRRVPTRPTLDKQSHFPDKNTEVFKFSRSEKGIKPTIPGTEDQDNNNEEKIRSHSVELWEKKNIKVRK